MLKPKPGDIAYFDECVEGGEPFRVVVCYKYFPGNYPQPTTPFWTERVPGRWGWYNTEGMMKPLREDHYGLRQLRLLLRDGMRVDGFIPVAQYSKPDLIRYEGVE